MGKDRKPHNFLYDVTGSLCENNNKFAIDRKLPKLERGDIIVIHDAGPHGYAMGFNYNGKLRSAELLLRKKEMSCKSAGLKPSKTISPHWISKD